MNLDTADPDTVTIADVNERSEARMISGLQGNVAERGILQPPLVRSDGEGGLECVVGGRRVIAAQRAHLDELPVLVVEWSDAEALAASISENAEVFRESVSAQDRAEALGRLWELLGGEGVPSSAKLAEKLGAPQQSVDVWIEPLRNEWEDTSVNPDSAGSTDFDSVDGSGTITDEEGTDSQYPSESGEEAGGAASTADEDSGDPDGSEEEEPLDIDAVGERNLQEIRLATGGGEAGVELAREVADGNLGREELREIKGRVRRGEGLQTAVEAATSDEAAVALDGGALATVDEADRGESEAVREEESRDPVTVEASFEGEAADALEGAALATDREPVAIVEEATVGYLDAKEWLQ